MHLFIVGERLINKGDKRVERDKQKAKSIFRDRQWEEGEEKKRK